VGAVSRLTIADILAMGPVMPVLTIERLADAAPLARALLAGGLRVVEVTLRTPAALAAIAAITAEVPEMVVGAGTVLNAADLERAHRAGAQFAVSPGLTDALVRAMAEDPLPFCPGIATPSELMRGLEAGLRHFKFFPAESLGGVAALRALHGPFGDCVFCPSGGITAATAPQYLALPFVPCVGGGWVAPRQAIADGDWARITGLARNACGLAPER
jgi:2-dehydro-3-deoxyphosphogluconate aldolase/(4S)-4-hydroxy-2-oxoglutarate aldolase